MEDEEDEQANNLLYRNMTISEMQKNYSSINWERIFTAVVPDHVKLTDNDTVAFESFSFLAAMNELLEIIPKRTIVNFIIMKIIGSHYTSLTGQNTPYEESEKNTQPWDLRCKTFVMNRLPILMNSIYVRKFFNFEKKNLVLEMVEGIRKEFKKILSKSTWMDKKTKKMAIKKLKNIEALIGYSDELIDDAVLMRHHENLTINEENFYESFLSLNIFDNFHNFKNLHKSINKTDWEINSNFLLEINAYYMPYDNNISEYKILNIFQKR